MNKTLIIIAVIFLVVCMTAGVTILSIMRPDSTAVFIGFCTSILTSLITAIVIIYNLNKTNEKVELIEKNTNGINTALLAKITGHSKEEVDEMKGR